MPLPASSASAMLLSWRRSLLAAPSRLPTLRRAATTCRSIDENLDSRWLLLTGVLVLLQLAAVDLTEYFVDQHLQAAQDCRHRLLSPFDEGNIRRKQEVSHARRYGLLFSAWTNHAPRWDNHRIRQAVAEIAPLPIGKPRSFGVASTTASRIAITGATRRTLKGPPCSPARD
jgi:hypothetical protein